MNHKEDPEIQLQHRTEQNSGGVFFLQLSGNVQIKLSGDWISASGTAAGRQAVIPLGR